MLAKPVSLFWGLRLLVSRPQKYTCKIPKFVGHSKGSFNREVHNGKYPSFTLQATEQVQLY